MSEIAIPSTPQVHPLLEQLVSRHGFTPLDADSIDAFVAGAGHALLVFTEDPFRYKETLDLAVIAPEIARAFEGRFRVGVLLPAAARKVAPRYGFAHWPALVMLKDGAYVGAIDGLRNWDEYLEETMRLLSRGATRPPSVGIAVRSTAASGSGCGH
jgi:hydrogenase-1 operon protein HyaE